jgi:hypothetical protein
MWRWLRNRDADHHRSAYNDRNAGDHHRTNHHGTGYDHD